MHITIGTAPQKDLNLVTDIKLVKAALLYADRTKLCSPAYSILLPMLELGKRTPEEQLDFLERILPYSNLSAEQIEIALQNIKGEREQLRGGGFSINRLFARIRAKKRFEEKWELIRNKFEPLGQDVAVEEFGRAVEANLLEIQTFKTLEEADVKNKGFYTDLEGTTAKLVKEFVGVVGKTIADGSTYPLFDDSIRNEIRRRIEQGIIDPSELRINQAKQTRLATDLLKRLPVLDEVPIDELINIRNELERPLHRFRSGIIEYAEEIKSAAWGKDFQAEAEQLFIRRIGPAILEIEEAIETRSSFAGLVVKKASAATLASGGVLSMILDKVALLPSYAALALGGALTTTAILHEAYKEWQKQEQEIEKNQLYFYYEVTERLS